MTTSMERVVTALGHREPDRVPCFLLMTMHGARELGMSIKEYFSKAENVAKGQMVLQEKFGSDCLFPLFYAAIEVEAWGAEIIFVDEGPPNSGRPIITKEDIGSLEPPEVESSPMLREELKAIRLLKEWAGERIPIIGVVVSPFSLPVMQMGFPSYLDILFDHPDLFWDLMGVNEEFCVEWANLQLEAGATAICYFDPVSSTTIVTPEQYRIMGLRVAKETLREIKGMTATHFGSGRCIEIIDHVAETGTSAIGVSSLEDLNELKKKCRGRLSILGNLNGIEMKRWTVGEAEKKVREAIQAAAQGGGFILSDNHGEIPYQVGDDVLHAIMSAVKKWGQYPIGEL